MGGSRSCLNDPAASLRLSVATRYWHCARMVLADQVRQFEYMEPVGYLLAMASELTLKAYLLEAGVSPTELAKRVLGHDLGALLLRSVRHGLLLSDIDAAGILAMRAAHLEHFHRYGPADLSGGAFTIALAEEGKMLVVVGHLIDLVAGDPAMLRWQHERPAELDWPLALPPTTPAGLDRVASLIEEAEAFAATVESFGKPHRPR